MCLSLLLRCPVCGGRGDRATGSPASEAILTPQVDHAACSGGVSSGLIAGPLAQIGREGGPAFWAGKKSAKCLSLLLLTYF